MAFIRGEAGAYRVLAEIEAGASIPAVNLAELATLVTNTGESEESVRRVISDMQLDVIPFDEELAYQAGLLVSLTRSRGLSLGDRACLATAMHHKLRILTGDRAWQGLPFDVEIEFFR